MDIVLGGHDHHYAATKVKPTGTWYVKSGADFKWMSRIDMHVGAGGKGRGEVTVKKLEVTAQLAEEPAMKAVVDHYMDNLKAAMGRELGKLGGDVDARFAMVQASLSLPPVLRACVPCAWLLLTMRSVRSLGSSHPPLRSGPSAASSGAHAGDQLRKLRR